MKFIKKVFLKNIQNNNTYFLATSEKIVKLLKIKEFILFIMLSIFIFTIIYSCIYSNSRKLIISFAPIFQTG